MILLLFLDSIKALSPPNLHMIVSTALFITHDEVFSEFRSHLTSWGDFFCLLEGELKENPGLLIQKIFVKKNRQSRKVSRKI
jgi:hypothetical protein